MSEYHLSTAQTARLPSAWYHEQRVSLDNRRGALRVADQRSSSTGISTLIEARPFYKEEWPQAALEIPDIYPAAAPELRAYRENDVYKSSEIIPILYTDGVIGDTVSVTSEALVKRIGLRSATLPDRDRDSVTVASSDQVATNAIANMLVLRSFAEQSVLNQANEWLRNGREAARKGDLRAGYHGAFRGLDLLMKDAMWKRVSLELKKSCSENFPVTFGIGVMRFASSAAQRIPEWDAILENLVNTATRQKVDVRKAFRGLIDVHGSK